jgi:hypothetical protein
VADDAKPSFETKRRKSGPARLSALVPGMIEPVLRQRGFANATILTEWAEIAGPSLARFTAPIELKWPKIRPETGDGRIARTGKAEKAEKGVLVVSVASAFALELQMGSAGLIQQINRRLGFECIGSIQIRQGIVTKQPRKTRRTADPALVACMQAGMTDIRDEPLRAALAVLGAEVQRGKT